MSAIRVYVDGRPDWLPVDDGCSPSRSSKGIRGGIGNPVIFGSLAVGESQKTIADRGKREYNARRDRSERAAADHDYYQRNKATIMAKQRERRAL